MSVCIRDVWEGIIELQYGRDGQQGSSKKYTKVDVDVEFGNSSALELTLLYVLYSQNSTEYNPRCFRNAC